jgi:DNA-binding FrmR family transcriptional regulator
MKKSANHKKRALHRIKIIQGHMKSIEKMIEEDKYCIDVLHQSLAVQKALKNLDIFIMEDHLKTCVVDQVKGGEEEKMVKDLTGIYKFK